MTISKSLRLAVATAALVLGSAANAAAMTVYKSASCGCCSKWVEHVEKHGFTVKVVNVDDVRSVKAKAGIPDRLASCHTSMVGGYVVEGHVPAADIKKLLAQKPKAKGIAVAGMPMGAPGMEHGDHREAFETVLIKADGSTATFARH
jgi:hypothetical protein